MAVAIIHWAKESGIPIFLAVVVLVLLGKALFMIRRPWANRVARATGYNSIADQFKVPDGTKIELAAPEPPENWSTERKFMFRTGQLDALGRLDAHNRRVEADLKRSRKRASGPKRRKQAR